MEWENILAISAFMLASPFAGVGLLFYIRRKRKELKTLKHSIKTGIWQQNYDYQFQGKYKIKLDKWNLKQEKKKIKGGEVNEKIDKSEIQEEIS